MWAPAPRQYSRHPQLHQVSYIMWLSCVKYSWAWQGWIRFAAIVVMWWWNTALEGGWRSLQNVTAVHLVLVELFQSEARPLDLRSAILQPYFLNPSQTLQNLWVGHLFQCHVIYFKPSKKKKSIHTCFLHLTWETGSQVDSLKFKR